MSKVIKQKKIVCTDKNKNKNKTNIPPLPFHSVTVFLIAEKLLSLWLFVLQICWRLEEKNILNFGF